MENTFHNELWAWAFSGKFATGMTWHWERVFWWTGALQAPPSDPVIVDTRQWLPGVYRVRIESFDGPHTLSITKVR